MLPEKMEEKHFNAHDDWTPEQRAEAFRQLRDAVNGKP
jgi:hypothetical protein